MSIHWTQKRFLTETDTVYTVNHHYTLTIQSVEQVTDRNSPIKTIPHLKAVENFIFYLKNLSQQFFTQAQKESGWGQEMNSKSPLCDTPKRMLAW